MSRCTLDWRGICKKTIDAQLLPNGHTHCFFVLHLLKIWIFRDGYEGLYAMMTMMMGIVVSWCSKYKFLDLILLT